METFLFSIQVRNHSNESEKDESNRDESEIEKKN